MPYTLQVGLDADIKRQFWDGMDYIMQAIRFGVNVITREDLDGQVRNNQHGVQKGSWWIWIYVMRMWLERAF